MVQFLVMNYFSILLQPRTETRDLSLLSDDPWPELSDETWLSPERKTNVTKRTKNQCLVAYTAKSKEDLQNAL